MYTSEGTPYLICRYGKLLFKKVANDSGTVNIYYLFGSDENNPSFIKEVNVFTNYSIKSDPDKFIKVCEEWLKNLDKKTVQSNR